MIKTSEWVSLGHPDKMADYISCFLLDRYLERDPMTRFAVEVQIKDQFVTLAGEVTSTAQFSDDDLAALVKVAVNQIGYTREYQQYWGRENTICGYDLEVTVHIGQQSPDIAQGVDRVAWGDQGIFWGMAVKNPLTDDMPFDHALAKKIGLALFESGIGGLDIKTQVTVQEDQVTEVIVAVPVKDDEQQRKVEEFIRQFIENDNVKIIVNGTGKFIIHGPVGDCGTTGRKLAVDFYGGNCKIGGGCVDAETEYLAPDGWRRICEYRGGKVAQVDENMNMSFVEPERYIQTESDEVYDISMDNTLSMVLSGNHRVFYKTSRGNYRKKSLLELISESDSSLRGSHAEIPRCFRYDFFSGMANHSDAMAQLLIAHCADGTVIAKTNARFNCRISVKRERKIERLRWILERTGKDFSEKLNNDGYTRFYYHLDDPSKLLSKHFYNPSMEIAKLLVKETLLWDGSEKLGEYRTTIKADADFMQFVFSGVTGNVYSIITRDKVEPGYSAIYTVRMVRHRFCSPFRKNIQGGNRIKRLEQQQVYCFTVPSGLLLLRRKNYIFVTGNSPWTKDGSKADLALNIYARELARNYLNTHELNEVHCAISCCIGRKEITVSFFDANNNLLESSTVESNPDEIINRFHLRQPFFAEMCYRGLFANV